MQINLFAEETQLQKLTKLGDSLEKLNIIDFESFRPLLVSAGWMGGFFEVTLICFLIQTVLNKRFLSALFFGFSHIVVPFIRRLLTALLHRVIDIFPQHCAVFP